jgi:hypothetical protein
MTVVCSGNTRRERPGYTRNCTRFRRGIERGYRSENGPSVRMILTERLRFTSVLTILVINKKLYTYVLISFIHFWVHLFSFGTSRHIGLHRPTPGADPGSGERGGAGRFTLKFTVSFKDFSKTSSFKILEDLSIIRVYTRNDIVHTVEKIIRLLIVFLSGPLHKGNTMWKIIGNKPRVSSAISTVLCNYPGCWCVYI